VFAFVFAFGTVYFFSAVQGTVWFAAHVVGVILAAAYLLFAIEAQRPWLAGLMLGLGFLTRTPLLFAFPFFVVEAGRVSTREWPTEKARAWWRAFDRRTFAKRLVAFALPVLAILAVALWYNAARFDDPLDFGYKYLTVRWQERMQRWGLFHYHYLARNLGVVFTSLPFTGTDQVPFRINAHGLALWVTTPLYLWLVWPRRSGPLLAALWVTVFAVAVPTLFYQNTGWVQFGYRFSNDYAVFLFALLAIGNYRFGALFWVAALFSIGVNAFGAATFERARYRDYYFVDPTQRILYQPD
jgi:hypothetical protein